MNKEKETAVGPNGKIRPTDPIANQTVALGVARGIREEEYVEEDGNISVKEITTRRRDALNRCKHGPAPIGAG